jgi:hypothetical protein
VHLYFLSPSHRHHEHGTTSCGTGRISNRESFRWYVINTSSWWSSLFNEYRRILAYFAIYSGHHTAQHSLPRMGFDEHRPAVRSYAFYCTDHTRMWIAGVYCDRVTPDTVQHWVLDQSRMWEAFIKQGDKPNGPISFFATFVDLRNVLRMACFVAEIIILDLLLVCRIDPDET